MKKKLKKMVLVLFAVTLTYASSINFYREVDILEVRGFGGNSEECWVYCVADDVDNCFSIFDWWCKSMGAI